MEDVKFETGPDRPQPIGFVLNPQQEPEEWRELPTLFRAGYTVVAGWVVDAASGKPLPGVRIRVDGGRAEEVTNDRGYFALSVPAPTPRTIQGVEMPGTGTVLAQLPNYKTFIAKNVMLPDGMDAPMNIQLERGLGSIEQDYCHKLDTECQQRSQKPGASQEVM